MPYKDPEVARIKGREASQRWWKKRQQERLEATLVAIAERPVIEITERAYAAGMFEGEGTATIATHQRKDGSGKLGYNCMVSVTSTDYEIIQFFHERWPAYSIYAPPPTNPNHSQKWVWTLHGPRILNFLADLEPFLQRQSMKRKFQIVREAQLLPRQGTRDPAIMERVVELTAEIRILNRRGGHSGDHLGNASNGGRVPPCS